MRMKYFGDSYDIVKQSLLRWLRPLGDWSVHPMFTEPVPPEKAAAFAEFLDAEIVSTEVLTSATDRSSYFSCAEPFGNLLLDPDTGLRLQRTRPGKAPAYMFAPELISLVERRPDALNLVFDQSFSYGSGHLKVKDKLRHLHRHEVFGFAYVSHACFVVVSQDQALVDRAYRQLASESKLPGERLLRVGPT
jgi:hypothetical protein